MTLTIGLTGGIASGKSLVQSQFEALGVPVLDADRVARDVVAPGSPGLAAIAAQFGADFIAADGGLDRRRMREHVFADAAARQRLEAITHPLIRERMRAWRATQRGPYCMLSVAILLEAKMQDMVDRVLLVDAPVELQLARLVERDRIAESLARQMLAAQLSREARLGAAHDVLFNAGEPAAVRQAVASLHRYYLQLAERGDFKAPGLRLPAIENSFTIKI
ncbi:dephospho-CoA kinase [Solimonas soli]|uniref:dephospho-CoA kinase n=1 Tax=Solimonas soli TaxID=413479 RepID=UPI00048505D5|nr:dephospho-CoA kinase [Solimonas soli]